MAANNDNRMPAWPGWETVRLIGRGSFGAVYVIQRTIGTTVEKSALKVITIPKESSEIKELSLKGYYKESITERFLGLKDSIVDEYGMMAKLKGCSNVVYCDDIRTIPHDDQIGWDIYIRMELLTPLLECSLDLTNEREIIRLGKELCSALVMCQKYNIVHRDIKPQNIFVSGDGTFKLGDFGIAKAVEHTTSGTLTGTYDYMAPEVELHRPYNRTVDIYSLGMVLYWYLNKRRLPFLPMPPAKIAYGDETEAKEKRLHGEPVPAPAHGSEELKRIVLKACAYDPKKRYQSAEEMLRDLEALDGKTSVQHSDAFVRRSEDQEPEAGDTVGAFNAPAPARPVQRSAKSEEKKEDGGTGDVTVDAFDRGNAPTPPQPKPRRKAWPILVGLALLALLAVGFFTVHIWTPATCETAEKCRICGKPRGEALGHDWGEWSVVTEPSCTEAGLEQRICANDPSHIETREIPATGHTWKDATCTEPSVCTVCGAESDGPIGHDWGEPTYTWSTDNSMVAAKRVCRHDDGHVEEEAVSTSSEITTPASCTAMGKTTYTASFSKDAFSTQTKTVENIPVTDHSWSGFSYSWSSDNSSCTAARTCSVCGNTETETVKTTSKVTTAATCTEKGRTTYTASFGNSAFSTQTKTVEDIAATGHKWSSVSYSWTSDNGSCTATRACSVCGNTESETAKTTSKVTTAATSTQKGKTTYTATFSNTAFATQTKTAADIPATDHNAKVGDYITFGSYEQDNNTANGKEPIEWLVLAREGDRVLLISRYALDSQPYNTLLESVTWETCSLREWLNGTFLNAAFSADERAMIPTVTVRAEKNPSYSTSPGNSTTDQVFLLSITEANKYFSSDEARKCTLTAYAIVQGVWTSDSNSIDGEDWWLRSPGYSSYLAAQVRSDGYIINVGESVYKSREAVRPALWVDFGS